MLIYSVFNSRKELLATFTDKAELARYVVRHRRDTEDTTILVTFPNSWNEVTEVLDETKKLMDEIWTEHSLKYT